MENISETSPARQLLAIENLYVYFYFFPMALLSPRDLINLEMKRILRPTQKRWARLRKFALFDTKKILEAGDLERRLTPQSLN